ncbi:MAG: MBL fold metallo-hydrolase [Planctomycetes bacterium]|nr:MBL fold metallo-hydrolase [Planctomycetota bacterium]
MKITFFGAAEGVTGSKHMLETDGAKVLLDCGLFQGRRDETEGMNRNLPFNPAKLASLVLSHAHIDHSGNIPYLTKLGFNSPIHATTATQSLCGIMLPDSAHIQEKDAEYINKIEKRKGAKEKKPLYTLQDAQKSLGLFDGCFYKEEFQPAPNIKAVFQDAGHILGSASIRLSVKENGTVKTVVFTGDLGRKNLPIIRNPEPFDYADVLITETTYGNRVHDPVEQVEEKLAAIINRVYQRGGKILIPAFSVGRSQEIIYTLNRLIVRGRIPEFPVFIDSPLTLNATEVFFNNKEYFDDEALQTYENEYDPFGFNLMTYITSVEESKKLNTFNRPCIIISGSGMCEHGRILHHLANNIGNPRNIVLIVGFQAQGTLGRRLVEKMEEVRIFGVKYKRRAEIAVINAFSAHGDRNDLFNYLKGFKKPPKKIFLVHGESDSLTAYADMLKSNGYHNFEIPKLGESFQL